MPFVHVPDFYDNLIEGYYFKEIVRAILDKCGYMVFPYGYESAFSYIKIQLHKGNLRNSPTAQKIRSSPDLLVYDMDKKDIMLVEVKSRNFDDETSVVLDKISWYQKYWEESILVVVIPHGHWFYAQYVSKLEAEEELSHDLICHDLTKEFEKFEDIFRKVDVDTLYRFKWNAAREMGRSEEHLFYFPERDERTFSSQLLALLEKNQGASFEKLFNLYNSINLVSNKHFNQAIERLIKDKKIRTVQGKFYTA